MQYSEHLLNINDGEIVTISQTLDQTVSVTLTDPEFNPGK